MSGNDENNKKTYGTRYQLKILQQEYKEFQPNARSSEYHNSITPEKELDGIFGKSSKTPRSPTFEKKCTLNATIDQNLSEPIDKSISSPKTLPNQEKEVNKLLDSCTSDNALISYSQKSDQNQICEAHEVNNFLPYSKNSDPNFDKLKLKEQDSEITAECYKTKKTEEKLENSSLGFSNSHESQKEHLFNLGNYNRDIENWSFNYSQQTIKNHTLSQKNLEPNLNFTIQQTNLSNSVTMSNTTILEASAANRQPVMPKFSPPTNFNPATSNVISFIQTFEKAAIANGWNNEYKINYLGAYLSDAANAWYLKYKTNPINRDKTWDNIKLALIEEYGGDSASRELKVQLQNKKQGPSEDIKSYFYDLMALSDQLGDVSDERFIEYFENGLHPIFKQKYTEWREPNMNMSQLKKIVNKLKEVYQVALEAQMNNAFLALNINSSSDQINPNSEVLQGNNQSNIRQRSQINSNYNSYNATRSFNTRFNNNQTLPVTRTINNRPRCFRCNKIGHYARSCMTSITTSYIPNNYQNRSFNNFSRNDATPRHLAQNNYSQNQFYNQTNRNNPDRLNMRQSFSGNNQYNARTFANRNPNVSGAQ